MVITGVSSGFGAGGARACAGKGYRVWGTMRDTAGHSSAKRSVLEAHSSEISVLEMDVTDDASVRGAFAEIVAEGPIDILINNAGIMYLGITEAFSVAQAKEQMETNHFGAIRTLQAALPSMRAARSGLIINTSSLVGGDGLKGFMAAMPTEQWVFKCTARSILYPQRARTTRRSLATSPRPTGPVAHRSARTPCLCSAPAAPRVRLCGVARPFRQQGLARQWHHEGAPRPCRAAGVLRARGKAARFLRNRRAEPGALRPPWRAEGQGREPVDWDWV